MKKIIALILLVLILCTSLFSLTSCGKIEDVKGIKVTSITLEFNFYEVATYQKNELKDKISSDSRFEKLENNLWLADGDLLRFSVNFIVRFNLFIILRNFIIFLKEKIKIIWQKKSTI